jgi:hypothetical protein
LQAVFTGAFRDIEGIIGGADTFGRRHCSRGISLGHNHHEFLASVTGHNVHLARIVLDRPRHIPQDFIAQLVAVGVIKMLELLHFLCYLLKYIINT